jgi:hypothetical protein
VVGRGDLEPAVAGRLPAPLEPSEFRPDFVLAVVPALRDIAPMRALEFAARRYSYSRELDPARVHPWTVAAITRDLRRARGRLGAVPTLETSIYTPERLLGSERARGMVGRQRLLIIAGLGAAALLGFALLAATLRRRDVSAELERLRDAGAQPWQLRAFVGLEAAALALSGIVAGVAIAVGLTVLLGAVEAGDPGLFLREALFDRQTAALVAAAWLAATLILAGALRGGGDLRRGRGLAAELAAAGGLVLLVWQAEQRGALGPRELAATSSAPPELLVVPGLLALVTALLAARAAGPALRRLERLARPAGVTVQLAVLSLTRRPARTSAAVGFLAAGVTLGLFALSHADELRSGARAGAAFAAGADLRVREAGPRDGDAGDVLPLARYASLPGTGAAAPALRARAEPLSAATGIARVTLLGLPANEIDRFPALRDAVGERAERLAGDAGPLRLEGPAIPPGTTWLSTRVSLRGTDAMLSLAIENAQGRIERLPFDRNPTAAPSLLRTRAPAGGGRVVGVELTPSLGRGRTGTVATARLGPLTADGGRVVTRFEPGSWQATPRVEAITRAGRFRFDTVLSVGTVGLVAAQPAAARPIPAVVSPRLAAEADADHVLPLRLSTGETFKVSVAATAERLPTAARDFVLVDARRAYRALNGSLAGTIAPNEIWLTTVPGGEAQALAALKGSRFRAASVVSRHRLTERAEADAVARSAIGALRVAAVLALVMAACGLALTVRSALTDGAQELAELEAMGVTPRDLRRQLRIGAAVVGAGGAIVGVGGAVGLTALFNGLVRVSADGREAVPPLQGELAWGLAPAALVAGALLGGLWVVLVTWRAFRADAAGRLGG